MTALLSLVLSACSGSGDTGSPATPPTPSETTMTRMTTSASLAPTVDPEAALRRAAAASCTRARQVGVVETRDDGTAIWVLVPDDLAYRDYTAAYLEYPDTYELALETSFFAACSADVEFGIRDESEMTPASVTLGSAPNEYVMTIPIDDAREWTVRYRLSDDGLISEAYYPGNADVGSWTTRIRYGDISPDERKILLIAVDRFVAQ